MANSILADCLTAIDQQTHNVKTSTQLNRLLKLKRQLLSISQTKWKPKFSDHFVFGSPLTAIDGGC